MKVYMRIKRPRTPVSEPFYLGEWAVLPQPGDSITSLLQSVDGVVESRQFVNDGEWICWLTVREG